MKKIISTILLGSALFVAGNSVLAGYGNSSYYVIPTYSSYTYTSGCNTYRYDPYTKVSTFLYTTCQTSNYTYTYPTYTYPTYNTGYTYTYPSTYYTYQACNGSWYPSYSNNCNNGNNYNNNGNCGGYYYTYGSQNCYNNNNSYYQNDYGSNYNYGYNNNYNYNYNNNQNNSCYYLNGNYVCR